jgi:hypothetical protein
LFCPGKLAAREFPRAEVTICTATGGYGVVAAEPSYRSPSLMSICCSQVQADPYASAFVGASWGMSITLDCF